MNTLSSAYAEHGVHLLETALRHQPPPGVTTEFVAQFFGQYRALLAGELTRLIQQTLAAHPPAPDLVRPAPASAWMPEHLPPDEWPAAARTAANLAALRMIASGAPIGANERTELLRYSGWGGCRLMRLRTKFRKAGSQRPVDLFTSITPRPKSPVRSRACCVLSS